MSGTDFFELPVGDQHRECIEVETDYERGVMDERKRGQERRCETCKYFRKGDKACFKKNINFYIRPASIDFSGCGEHEPKGSE